MIKKFFLALLLFVSLSGCQQASQLNNQTVEKTLARVIKKIDQYQFTNISKTYYSYYLPKTLGRRYSTNFSNVLVGDGHEIIMTISAEEVILDHDSYPNSNVERENYDVFVKDLDNKLIYLDGSYQHNGKNVPYLIYVYPIENDAYFISLKFGYAKISTQARASQVVSVLEDMMIVGVSLDVNDRRVVADYLNQEIDVTNVDSNLNVEYFPEEGILTKIDDISNDDRGNVDPINRLLLTPRIEPEQAVDSPANAEDQGGN